MIDDDGNFEFLFWNFISLIVIAVEIDFQLSNPVQNATPQLN